MKSECPKCGKKLSIFYFKPKCPQCGCELAYYDMDKMLEEDAKKAEAEFAKLDAFIDKMTPKFIKKKMKKDMSDSK